MNADSVDPVIYWVKAILPTTLGDLDWLPIPVTDKLLIPVSDRHARPVLDIISNAFTNSSIKIDVVWVFPGPLDLEKLKHALAQTLRDYPHAAGRVLHEPSTKTWRIRLTNEGVPISTSSTQNPGIFSYEFNHQRSPEVLDSLKFPGNPLDLVKEPLVRFKLTSWEKTGETSLSVSFCHMLGRAFNSLDDS